MKVTINIVEGKSFECNGVITFTESKYATQYINSVDPQQDRWLKTEFEVDFGEHQYAGRINTGEVTEDFCIVEHVEKCLTYYAKKENSPQAQEMLREIDFEKYSTKRV